MNSFRYLRPIASRLQAPTLPRLTRGYASGSYEYIQVSNPKPGVGQGECPLSQLRFACS